MFATTLEFIVSIQPAVAHPELVFQHVSFALHTNAEIASVWSQVVSWHVCSSHGEDRGHGAVLTSAYKAPNKLTFDDISSCCFELWLAHNLEIMWQFRFLSLFFKIFFGFLDKKTCRIILKLRQEVSLIRETWQIRKRVQIWSRPYLEILTAATNPFSHRKAPFCST